MTASSSDWLIPPAPNRISLSRGRRTLAGRSRTFLCLRVASPDGGASGGSMESPGRSVLSAISPGRSKPRAATPPPGLPGGRGPARPDTDSVRGRLEREGHTGRRCGAPAAVSGRAEDPVALDAQPAGKIKSDGAAVKDVLLLKDARPQRLRRVAVEDRHRLLQDDRTGVRALVHEMNRAAADPDARLDGLALGLPAGERRQERRVDVHDAPGEALHEPRRQEAHVSGETDQTSAGRLEGRGHLPVVRLAARAPA